ncbi:TetR/AcrR family transcriptional regulator [Paraclostridium bifermentans]|uniref:TetR/AcrR family transcriptional regulator n=1 Tax=Paraclostridium bifermentans TaxID=1490 RepID=UPI002909637A|nr:TetR/AcrR family transcriptional regulator [Paraclostridium bifermentans]MDU3338240.1 TetR/AcrR family transcriptional regulator [Paraclostridium bifermentans]
MARNFTEFDISSLKNKLKEECEKSWKENGYKSTNIAYLTKKVGISTGSFYRIYETKEDLFFEVFSMIQINLKDKLKYIINQNKGLEGFKNAFKWLFKEYSSYPKLYNFNNPDYLLFINKLSSKDIESLKLHNEDFFHETLINSSLSLKIPKEKAYAILNTLLVTSTIDKEFSYNKLEVFEFLLESSIKNIFN